MVLISAVCISMYWMPLSGFRPLAGIMVLIGIEDFGYGKGYTYVFPSPCGDCGSYQILRGSYPNDAWKLFPSPCGDCGSYRESEKSYPWAVIKCFRPLAGIMVLIKPTTPYKYAIVNKVSVPLRGLWFLSMVANLTLTTNISSFRPLAGIMVLIIMNANYTLPKGHTCFRPLAGIMVLIRYSGCSRV